MDTAREIQKEQKPVTKVKPKKSNAIYFGGVSPIAVALSIRHLSLMLKSSLALNDAIKILGEKTTDTRLREAYADISIKIDEGMPLSDAMKQHNKIFSDITISIVNVGEQGGTLEKNLIFIADYLKKGNDLNKKVKGALIYPAITFFITVAEMMGVIFLILPKLEELFRTFENIPDLTRFILDATGFIRANALYILIIIIIYAVASNLYFATKSGKITKDRIGLVIPVIKDLNKNNVLATFARTMNILLETGIPIEKAMEITSTTVGNSVYENILIKVSENVKAGKTIAESLEIYEKYFPPTFTKMIEIGENTGALQENLFYLYEFHADEVDEMATNLSTLLEPILMVVIGCMIGLLALVIISPIYQLTGSINS